MKTPRLIAVILAIAAYFLGTAFAQTGALKINPNTGAIVGPVTGATFISANSLISTSSGFSNGTSSAPGITFSSDTDTGFYRIGANNIGITAGTTVVGAWSTTGLSLGGTIATAVGTAASPILTFGGTGDGFYTPADNQIGIGIGGNSVAVMSASALTLGTNVAIAFAGTGAATTRTNIGLSIGTDVQAYDADLTTYAATTPGTGAIAQYLTPAIYESTATAGATKTLTVTSPTTQRFTGILSHVLAMPVVTTLTLGQSWRVVNASTGVLSVQSSGGNTIQAILPGQSAELVCNKVTADTTAAAWNVAQLSPPLWATNKLNADLSMGGWTTAAFSPPNNVAGSSLIAIGGGSHTALVSGSLEVSALIALESTVISSGIPGTANFTLTVKKNGAAALVLINAIQPDDGTNTFATTLPGTGVISVSSGDTISFEAAANFDDGFVVDATSQITIKYQQ